MITTPSISQEVGPLKYLVLRGRAFLRIHNKLGSEMLKSWPMVLAAAMADNTRVSYPSGSRPFGLTYGHWTVMWWRWALSIPKSVNPVMDETGRHASVGQPEELVWFLSGKFGTEGTVFPKRFCKIPYGRSILFPVINYEANPLEYPELGTEHQLLENVRKIEDTITRKQCFVDSIRIEAQRVQSDPKIFELDLAENGPLGVAGHTFAAADGYWIFLKPLNPGNHYISFDGSCEQGKLRSGARYSVHIDSV